MNRAEAVGMKGDIVLAASKAYSDWRAFLRSYAEMLPKIAEFKDAVGSESEAQKLLSPEELAVLSRVHRRSVLVRAQNASALNNRLVNLLKIVFNNRTSQTHELSPKVTAAGQQQFAITIGKYGFGVRHNVNSRELGHYEFVQFMKRADEIVAGLKQVKHLVSTAKDFEDFVTEYKKLKVLDVEEVVVDLKSPVLLFKDSIDYINNDRDDLMYHRYVPFIVDAVAVRVDEHRYGYGGDSCLVMRAVPTEQDRIIDGRKVYGDDTSFAEMICVFKKDDMRAHASGAMQMLMLRDQFAHIEELFEMQTAGYLKNEEILAGIETRFSRRLMMSSV
jgi:hypothetical protein